MTEIQPLARSHDRAAFDCGSDAINAFLMATARQHQDRGISRTFVLVDPDSERPARILGFFTLSACEGVSADLPSPLAKRLPRTLPAALLGRLAVDREFQGLSLPSNSRRLFLPLETLLCVANASRGS